MYTVKFTTAHKAHKRLGPNLSLPNTVVDTLRYGKQLRAKYRDYKSNGKFKGLRMSHYPTTGFWFIRSKITFKNLRLIDIRTHTDISNL